MLKRFVPGKWIDRAISEGDATFDAKLDEARKSAAKLTTKRGENGIMSSMKNRASSTLALTLAIAGAVALPLRSGAAERTAQMSLHLPKQGEFGDPAANHIGMNVANDVIHNFKEAV